MRDWRKNLQIQGGGLNFHDIIHILNRFVKFG